MVKQKHEEDDKDQWEKFLARIATTTTYREVMRRSLEGLERHPINVKAIMEGGFAGPSDAKRDD